MLLIIHHITKLCDVLRIQNAESIFNSLFIFNLKLLLDKKIDNLEIREVILHISVCCSVINGYKEKVIESNLSEFLLNIFLLMKVDHLKDFALILFINLVSEDEIGFQKDIFAASAEIFHTNEEIMYCVFMSIDHVLNTELSDFLVKLKLINDKIKAHALQNPVPQFKNAFIKIKTVLLIIDFVYEAGGEALFLNEKTWYKAYKVVDVIVHRLVNSFYFDQLYFVLSKLNKFEKLSYISNPVFKVLKICSTCDETSKFRASLKTLKRSLFSSLAEYLKLTGMDTEFNQILDTLQLTDDHTHNPDDEELCILCCENKVDTLIDPCNHGSILTRVLPLLRGTIKI